MTGLSAAYTYRCSTGSNNEFQSSNLIVFVFQQSQQLGNLSLLFGVSHFFWGKDGAGQWQPKDNSNVSFALKIQRNK